MTNTLYLPELREMLAEDDAAGLAEFCTALHPGRTAEFMEGLTPQESWQVLRHADLETRIEIFEFFELEKQVEMLETLDRQEMAELLGDLAADDRVDMLKQVDTEVVEELLPLVEEEERRDIIRLKAYPESTAGALMTTEVATVAQHLSAKSALEALAHQAEELETIYYIYVIDEENHLRGVVSARALLSAVSQPNVQVEEIMERHLVSVEADEDQEEVADRVAKYDLLAIPVVDHEHRLLGIITHDDVIDVVREEAIEDAQRMGAVDPLETTYLQTSLWTLTWKRGVWLVFLLFAALFTAVALKEYESGLEKWAWLALFIPLVISSGGNSGGQSATLVISALAAGHITLADWLRVVLRELALGVLLGGALALLAYLAAWALIGDYQAAIVVPITIIVVVVCGTLCGSVLPLLFHRIRIDPALMSTPFVAAIIDIVGIVIYMSVAIWLLD